MDEAEDKTPKPAVSEFPIAPITEMSDGCNMWTLVGVPLDISRGGQVKADPEILVWARTELLCKTKTMARVATPVENIVIS